MRNQRGYIKTPLQHARQCSECFSFLSLDVPPGTTICDNCARRKREHEAANDDEIIGTGFASAIGNAISALVSSNQGSVNTDSTPSFDGGGGETGGGGASSDY